MPACIHDFGFLGPKLLTSRTDEQRQLCEVPRLINVDIWKLDYELWRVYDFVYGNDD